ncbi:hypothetical protein Poli38472_010284 [Pythium oligandrum]|uniref:Crinkler effector protein N-terminal domain-containing protein n=1 Tax=Pythium oligandrum TaxID=41045 RepID=A0A8K1FCU8_PYTOL|nr:hypothetical protein Poli38472_010284 [Pythium oligandrum]|eukprot:TMW58725.1 hypothetical protein Poli38472_010284 [Pythium oligandrum]
MTLEISYVVYGDHNAELFQAQVPNHYKIIDLLVSIIQATPQRFQCDPIDLTLYRATDASGGWLRNDPDLSRVLLQGDASGQYPVLPMYMDLVDVFGREFTAEADTVQILVRPPDFLLSTIPQPAVWEDIAKSSTAFGSLPTEGEFLRLFEWSDDDCGTVKDMLAIQSTMGEDLVPAQLYVRKEMLCVLAIFKAKYGNVFDFSRITSQFVVMGSPGVGKSCLLALVCLYLAAKHRRPIIWRLETSIGTVVRLLYRHFYYEWVDPYGDVYTSIVRKTLLYSPWRFLDGVSLTDIRRHNWLYEFSLLTTHPSDEVVPRSWAPPCVLPYWQKQDLIRLGRRLKWTTDEAEARYFVSGGSVWAFLANRVQHEDILTSVKFDPDSYSGSDTLCMYGVDDINDLSAYEDTDRRTCDVTSRFKMLALVKHHASSGLKLQMRSIQMKKLSTGAVEDRLVFYGYFLEVLYNRRVLCVDRYDYAPTAVGRQKTQSQQASKKTLVWNEIVKSRANKLMHFEDKSGRSLGECIAIVAMWAIKPSKLDFWIPRTALAGIPDVVLKWTSPEAVQPEFYMIHLSTSARFHTFDSDVAVRVATPFLKRHFRVHLVFIVSGEAYLKTFRIVPEVSVEEANEKAFDVHEEMRNMFRSRWRQVKTKK